jgi:hypothetical protein
MDSGPLLYLSGEEVHIGDRVQYSSIYATVVFVSDGETEESAPGYEDYAGSARGMAICDDDGAVSFLGEPDERLVFTDRG